MTARVPEWTLGDRLRKIRRDADMTVADFAEVLGVSRASLGHYETDRNMPADVVALAKRIQLATGVPATWTLGLNDEAPGPVGPGAIADEVHPPGLEPGTHWLRVGRHLEAVAA